MEVNITKRIDTHDGRRFSKVIFTPNGRIKPDWVEVDERQEKRTPKGLLPRLDRRCSFLALLLSGVLACAEAWCSTTARWIFRKAEKRDLR
jgi:hypothetical protein